MKIGFIGLGTMGEPMALNLIKKGHTVLVYDIIDEKLLIAEKKGCIKKDSVKSAVKDVDFVITMLPEGRHVKEAYLNNNLPSGAHYFVISDNDYNIFDQLF